MGLTSRSPPTPTQEKVKERRERIMVEFEKMGLFLMEEKQRLLQAEDPGAHGERRGASRHNLGFPLSSPPLRIAESPAPVRSGPGR